MCVIQEESGKGSANRNWGSYRSFLNREGPRALGSKEIPTVSGSKSLYVFTYSSNITAVIYTLYMSLLVSTGQACACWLFGLFVIISVSCLSLSHSACFLSHVCLCLTLCLLSALFVKFVCFVLPTPTAFFCKVCCFVLPHSNSILL